MYTKLPDEQNRIMMRLIERRIGGRADIEGEIEGCSAIVRAFYATIVPTLGRRGADAVMQRTAALARQKYPQLRNLAIVEGRINGAQIQADLREEGIVSARQALIGIVNDLFYVMHQLLGNILSVILREVEEELAKA